MNTPDITVTLSDFGLTTATGVAVELAPNAVYGPVDTSHLKASTNSSGVATFSAIPPGQYILSIFTTGGASYTLIVPNQSATVAAFDHIVSEFHLPEVVVEPGSKEGEGDPTDSVTPDFSGQLYHDTEADSYYRSTGTTSADWAAISGDYQDMQVSWTPTNLNLGEMLAIYANNSLSGITSLTLSQAQSPLINLPSLSDLESIDAPDLASISSNLNLSGCVSLESADFPSLVSVGGTIDFSNDGALASVDFTSLSSVGPNLKVSNTLLSTLSFPALATVGDSFDIHDNALLATVSCPELLATTVGYFNAYNLAALVTLLCPKLATCGQGFNVLNDPLLLTISAPQLVDCGGYIQCYDNLALTTVNLSLVVPPNGCTVDFHNCALNLTSVNHILARCVANAAFVSGTVNLSGGTSVAPSGQGAADVITLTGRGVTVTTN